jgi:hypothetical protein
MKHGATARHRRTARSQTPSAGVATWRITAASTTGVAHRKRGRGNDDAFACASSRDGALLLAVADGAGSATRASQGSELAAETALAALATSEGGWRSRCAGALSRARRRLAAQAAMDGARLRDYASTLLLVEVDGDALRVAQLGDGAVVVLRAGALERPTAPGRGEHAGETVFATGRDAASQLTLAELPPTGVMGVALLSDGLESVALKGDAPFQPFFDPLFAFAASERPPTDRTRLLSGMLTSERIAARCHDDLTLLLAVPG